MSGLDQIFNDFNQMRTKRRVDERVADALEETKAAQANVDSLLNEFAAHVAEIAALVRQLQKFDPTNPLIDDESIIKKVRAAGVKATHLANGDTRAAALAGAAIRIRPNDTPRFPDVPEVPGVVKVQVKEQRNRFFKTETVQVVKYQIRGYQNLFDTAEAAATRARQTVEPGYTLAVAALQAIK